MFYFVWSGFTQGNFPWLVHAGRNRTPRERVPHRRWRQYFLLSEMVQPSIDLLLPRSYQGLLKNIIYICRFLHTCRYTLLPWCVGMIQTWPGLRTSRPRTNRRTSDITSSVWLVTDSIISGGNFIAFIFLNLHFTFFAYKMCGKLLQLGQRNTERLNDEFCHKRKSKFSLMAAWVAFPIWTYP